MTNPRPFPWQEAMGFAFARLHLSPDAFWAMTPRELAAAIRFVTGGSPQKPDHDALTRLMAAFPDSTER